ncbi:acyl-CoA dehydrogenase family protein [Streptomyces vilmorinianum]|uniref:acyl-CoA dehydrogenase family protein n=1 Tax=Streptomyces vilmorinianum TaxID=3051092 RepID=UPI0010FAE8C7|nr:acyl-CoA dehydrogenase family protein [Streptomyces vilmorinianum]
MDVTIAPHHEELRHTLTEVLDDELAPLIRRMADRPRHGTDTSDADVRAMVWRALTDLGVLRMPGGAGGHEALAVVAERLGELLYQGPLLDTVLAAETLLRSRTCPERDRLLKEIADGTSVAAAVRDGDPHPEDGALTVGAADDTVSAVRRFVTCAAEADWLLVTGRTPEGEHRTALLPRDHPTVRLRRQEELGRGETYAVELAATPVLAWLDLGPDPVAVWQRLAASARTLQAAYLVGLAAGALRLAVEHARERRQFGGPIGRQQSLAFTLARHATRIDAARLLTRVAAREADTGDDPRLSAAQAYAMAAELAKEASRDSVQIHGARGLTLDCEAQLFLRRSAVESLALGAPNRVRADVLPLLLASAASRRVRGER